MHNLSALADLEKIKDMKTADESARVRGEDFEVVEGFQINWASTFFVLLGLGIPSSLLSFRESVVLRVFPPQQANLRLVMHSHRWCWIPS